MKMALCGGVIFDVFFSRFMLRRIISFQIRVESVPPLC